jgi:hypothetical protein
MNKLAAAFPPVPTSPFAGRASQAGSEGAGGRLAGRAGADAGMLSSSPFAASLNSATQRLTTPRDNPLASATERRNAGGNPAREDAAGRSGAGERDPGADPLAEARETDREQNDDRAAFDDADHTEIAASEVSQLDHRSGGLDEPRREGEASDANRETGEAEQTPESEQSDAAQTNEEAGEVSEDDANNDAAGDQRGEVSADASTASNEGEGNAAERAQGNARPANAGSPQASGGVAAVESPIPADGAHADQGGGDGAGAQTKAATQSGSQPDQSVAAVKHAGEAQNDQASEAESSKQEASKHSAQAEAPPEAAGQPWAKKSGASASGVEPKQTTPGGEASRSPQAATADARAAGRVADDGAPPVAAREVAPPSERARSQTEQDGDRQATLRVGVSATPRGEQSVDASTQNGQQNHNGRGETDGQPKQAQTRAEAAHVKPMPEPLPPNTQQQPQQANGSARPISSLDPGGSSAERAGSAQRGQGENSQQLSAAERSALNARLSRGLGAALRQGNGAVTLRLAPETLGQLRISMNVSQGRVSVDLQAQSATAVRAVGESMAMLRGALEARGLEVERLTTSLINTRPSSESSNQQQSQSDTQQRQGQQQHDASDGRSRGFEGEQRRGGRRNAGGQAGAGDHAGLASGSRFSSVLGQKAD